LNRCLLEWNDTANENKPYSIDNQKEKEKNLVCNLKDKTLDESLLHKRNDRFLFLLGHQAIVFCFIYSSENKNNI